MENILELRNITKEFPGVKALDGITLEIQKGEIHAIVGEIHTDENYQRRVPQRNIWRDPEL